MLLDVTIERESMSIQIDDPFHIDLDSFAQRIEDFASKNGLDMHGLDVRALIPGMIRGIAGCERGCPADAKGFVSRGFAGFDLEYIEGGILSAAAKKGAGKVLHVKMFPDF